MVTAEVFAEYELTKSFDRPLDTLVPAMPARESTGVEVRGPAEYPDGQLPMLGMRGPAPGPLSFDDRMRDPPGDGSCGYHAIAEQLNIAKAWKPDLTNEIGNANWTMIRLRAFVAGKFMQNAAELMGSPTTRETIVNNYIERRQRFIQDIDLKLRRNPPNRDALQGLKEAYQGEIRVVQERGANCSLEPYKTAHAPLSIQAHGAASTPATAATHTSGRGSP